MALNRYSRKKETMPMYGHIFIGLIMAGFVAACLGYGSLAYLNYRTEQQEEKTRNALINQEKQRMAQKANYYKMQIKNKWGTISNQKQACKINTLTKERICQEK